MQYGDLTISRLPSTGVLSTGVYPVCLPLLFRKMLRVFGRGLDFSVLRCFFNWGWWCLYSGPLLTTLNSESGPYKPVSWCHHGMTQWVNGRMLEWMFAIIWMHTSRLEWTSELTNEWRHAWTNDLMSDWFERQEGRKETFKAWALMPEKPNSQTFQTPFLKEYTFSHTWGPALI